MSPPSRTMAPIPWPVLRMLLVRLAILAVVAGCSLIVWWSVSKRLMPAGEKVRKKTQEMNRLANDVQRLEVNWKPAEVEKTEMQFNQTRNRLFTGEDALPQWQKEIEREADALALQTIVQTGKARPHPAASQSLALQPVTIDVRPLEGGPITNSPYRRLLQFVQFIQDPNKRTDLLELSVSASSNSVQQAKLSLSLWTPGKVQP